MPSSPARIVWRCWIDPLCQAVRDLIPFRRLTSASAISSCCARSDRAAMALSTKPVSSASTASWLSEMVRIDRWRRYREAAAPQ